MKKILLSLLLWAVPAFALAATTFVWTQPSKNQDGAPLTDLKGNKVYCGTMSGQYTIIKDAGLPAPAGALAKYPITSVVPLGDNYFCAVTAYDKNGNEGGKSNEIAVPLDSTGPGAPEGLGVE